VKRHSDIPTSLFPIGEDEHFIFMPYSSTASTSTTYVDKIISSRVGDTSTLAGDISIPVGETSTPMEVTSEPLGVISQPKGVISNSVGDTLQSIEADIPPLSITDNTSLKTYNFEDSRLIPKLRFLNEINREGPWKFDRDGLDHEDEGSDLDDEERTIQCHSHTNIVASAAIITEPKTF